MDEYGISDDFGRTPFGEAYGRMIQRGAPVRPLPLPSPVQQTPLLSTRQFLGMPQVRARMLMNPVIPMGERMPGVSNVIPFSPARGPQAEQTQLTPEALTALIKAQESSGNYTALNTDNPGNTASGAYQYTDSTWNNYGGYSKAMLAPPEVQDRRFAEDITRRFEKYGGDPFKIIAEHYLPAYAGRPDTWTTPVTVHGRKVKPVATYIRQVIEGSPLEAQFDAYLTNNQN